MSDSIKVMFQLAQDKDGYPPVAVESVWANPSGDEGLFRLDSIPFFAKQATIGDLVRVRIDDGNLWFLEVAVRSANSLVRVIFFNEEAVPVVNQQLTSFGCSTEYIGAFRVLAVSVPATTDLRQVQVYLQARADAGTLDYEEALLRQ